MLEVLRVEVCGRSTWRVNMGNMQPEFHVLPGSCSVASRPLGNSSGHSAWSVSPASRAGLGLGPCLWPSRRAACFPCLQLPACLPAIRTGSLQATPLLFSWSINITLKRGQSHAILKSILILLSVNYNKEPWFHCSLWNMFPHVILFKFHVSQEIVLIGFHYKMPYFS